MAGEYDQVLRFAEHLENNFDSKNRGIWRGITYLVEGKPVLALDVYTANSALTNNRELQSLGFDAYLMMGQVEKSLKLLDKVVVTYLDQESPKLAATIRLNKPFILQNMQRYSEANLELDEIIKIAIGDENLNIIRFMAEYYKGINYIAASPTSCRKSSRVITVLADHV